VAEKKELITGEKIRKGDVLIGLASTGLHTNGYSLARAVLLKRYQINDYIDDLGKTVGEALLAVHRSYLRTVMALMKRYSLHGISHITGGGIEGNTNRIIPAGLRLHIDWNAWERPVLFRLIQRLGEIPEADARRAFNLGVGMILIVSRKNVDRILRFLRKQGEQTMVVGEVVSGRKG
jgi:phosphoribosylformylglycinamidine cyclo-ligase